MTKREVSFSDLSGQMAGSPDGLIPLVVTDHPDLDQQVRIEVTPEEMEKIGKLAIAAVGLETEPTGEEENRARFVIPLAKFASLATVAPMDEVLANAEPVVPPPKQPNGERRSHNRTATGEPLVNYGDPEYAGLPHYGRIGKKEQAYVQANLEAVNERRVAAGHPAINPADSADAERYGFTAAEQPAAQQPAPDEPATPEQP
jgi:hypothetical protein